MIREAAPLLQASLAGLFTWGVTALGAAVVFIMRSQNKKLLDISLGFAAGVMTAASFWSLLAPAIEISESSMEKLAFIPVSVGFAAGAAFVHFADRLIPSCVLGELSLVDAMAPKARDQTVSLMVEETSAIEMANGAAATLSQRVEEEQAAAEARNKGTTRVGAIGDERDSPFKESWRRIVLLILAVTVHNIPEGLAVGIGFASIGKTKAATFESAFNLALGIGLQNFPEGLAVSLPLAAFGHSKAKAFFYGQMSGMVEPLAALLGAGLVMIMEPVLPYALSFAAGAMIYVVVDDIIPEAQRHGNGKLASIGAIAGFIVMMSLDVGLGFQCTMFGSSSRLLPRLPSSYLDYARHLPKAYVDRMKRTVPKKTFTNRFGAPDVVLWRVHPDDYAPDGTRPWEQQTLSDSLKKEKKYMQSRLGNKFYELKRPDSKRMADEKWIFFVGDRVQVTVGRDRGKHGSVVKVCRETSQVWVEGLNAKLESAYDEKFLESHGLDKTYLWKEQPLSVLEGEVLLVDPNDENTCTAKWVESSDGSGYQRVSERSGFEIPIPSAAHVTYDYISKAEYIEAAAKDTPMVDALERTYVPRLATFTQEIAEQHGLPADEKRSPTYWY